MEVLGVRVPQVLVPLVSVCRQHPSMAVVGASATFAWSTYWYHSRQMRAMLLDSHQRIKADVVATQKACTTILSELDGSWNKDIRHKDTLLMQLQLQNVEQTRSIDSLNRALRQCTASVFSRQPPPPPPPPTRYQPPTLPPLLKAEALPPAASPDFATADVSAPSVAALVPTVSPAAVAVPTEPLATVPSEFVPPALPAVPQQAPPLPVTELAAAAVSPAPTVSPPTSA